MHKKTSFIVAAALLSAGSALAADNVNDPRVITANTASAPAAATSNATPPRNLPDDAYITLSGTVGKVLSKNAFELNYPGGTIKVTTDESWKSLYDTNAASMLKTGQKVTVSGRVDDNWFARKELDAYAINVQGTAGQSYSYNRNGYGAMTPSAGNAADANASGANTSDMAYFVTGTQYIGEGANVRMAGTVSRIEGDDFWLNYNGGIIKVDAGGMDMPANTLTIGDRVIVTGEVKDPFFTQKEIDAVSVTRVNMYQRSAAANKSAN